MVHLAWKNTAFAVFFYATAIQDGNLWLLWIRLCGLEKWLCGFGVWKISLFTMCPFRAVRAGFFIVLSWPCIVFTTNYGARMLFLFFISTFTAMKYDFVVFKSDFVVWKSVNAETLWLRGIWVSRNKNRPWRIFLRDRHTRREFVVIMDMTLWFGKMTLWFIKFFIGNYNWWKKILYSTYWHHNVDKNIRE